MTSNVVIPEEIMVSKKAKLPKPELKLQKNVIELYGFSGKMGTGKNYIAEKLFLAMLPKKNTLVMAFADHFKVDCCSKDKIQYRRVFIEKDTESRNMLQKRGTEEGRDVYGEDIWVDTLETWMRVYRERGVERFVVTDVRFKNEAEWVKKLGGVTFRVESPHRNLDRVRMEVGGDEEKMQKIMSHSSEIDLDNYGGFDYVIHNDYEHEGNVSNQVRDIIRDLIYREPVDLTIFCDMDDTICQCRQFYIGISDQVIELVKKRTLIPDNKLKELLNTYILSYEHRYFTREDFANSLVKLAMGAYMEQDMVMEFTEELKNRIYQLGMSVFNQKYDPLNPDSLDRVRELRKFGQVIIFTLGDHTEQMKKIVNLGLLDFQVEIFTHKDENMFRYLQNKYPSRRYVMIGDSYNRDIVPAMRAGIQNLVHISDRPLGDEVGEDVKKRIFQVDRLNGELMSHLSRLGKID